MVFVVASIVLMTLDHRDDQLEKLRAALTLVVYPLQYAVNLPVSGGQWLAESLETRHALLSENEHLREANLLLRSRVQKFSAIEAENARLRALLDSSVQFGDRVLVADLVAVELEPSSRQIVLDKGSNDGVYIGQPIVDAGGVMGQVTHVGPFSCTGMLITDPSHALPVQVNRSGLRAIAMGTGADDTLQLAYIPNNADIRVGDLLVTSGMGGRFPGGYPVAQVSSVELDPGAPFAKVTATPTAQLKRAREVLLVWPGKKPRDDSRFALTSTTD